MDIVSIRAADGNVHTAEIGGVIMQNNEHIFEYLPDESGDTLWPSMSNTMHGCYIIILFIRLLELALIYYYVCKCAILALVCRWTYSI